VGMVWSSNPIMSGIFLRCLLCYRYRGSRDVLRCVGWWIVNTQVRDGCQMFVSTLPGPAVVRCASLKRNDWNHESLILYEKPLEILKIRNDHQVSKCPSW